MCKLSSLLCLVLLTELVCGALFRQPPLEKPEEFALQEGCYSPDLNVVLKYNTELSPPANVAGCSRFFCDDNGWIVISTCGVVVAGPSCKVVDGNMTASYPECCPTIVCCDDERISADA